MWHDHPFSQKNNVIKRTLGLEVSEDRGIGQNLKNRGEVSNIGRGYVNCVEIFNVKQSKPQVKQSVNLLKSLS